MSSNHCLNCNTPLTGKFCQECGQPATTHRFSFKHFVVHDMVHGIWHIDKGIFHTLHHLFTRPGKFANEYLAGKRAGHFNLLTLLLIVVGLFLYFVLPHNRVFSPDGDIANMENKELAAISERIVVWLYNNAKWLVLAAIPLVSLSSMLVFRRKKYFYSEHLILNGYFFAAFVLVLLLADIVIQVLLSRNAVFNNWVDVTFAASYFVFAYWQTWKSNYTFVGWFWRLLIFVLLVALFVAIILGVAIVIWYQFVLKKYS